MKVIDICKSLEQELLSISTTQTTKYISIAKLSKIKIPFPSIIEQQKIVEELDSYQKIIDGLKQAIDNWKPSFEISSEWQILKISDIVESLKAGGDIPKDNYSKDKTIKYQFIQMGLLIKVYMDIQIL